MPVSPPRSSARRSKPALVRNRVDVVFSGHEHLYERSKPQQGGVVYFVSGGGGRYLHRFNRNPFTEVGVSEHHFMVAEVAGDRLFFAAISHAQGVFDCGVLFRTGEVKGDDENDGSSRRNATGRARFRGRRTCHKDSLRRIIYSARSASAGSMAVAACAGT